MRHLLDRFTADLGRVLPLEALWAHGSLALGDFQPSRSDLDLVALIAAPITGTQRQDLQRVHDAVMQERFGDNLHCAYMVRAEVADPGRTHVTWAHGGLIDRAVSQVSRRELQLGGLCLCGVAPAGVVPPVTDADLADYIRGDLQSTYYPATSRPELWLQDIWVDLGMLTLARATVTLRDGRLITKRAALEELTAIGAPASVVRDIYERRYETPPPICDEWRAERGSLAAAFVHSGIERLLSLPPEP